MFQLTFVLEQSLFLNFCLLIFLIFWTMRNEQWAIGFKFYSRNFLLSIREIKDIRTKIWSGDDFFFIGIQSTVKANQVIIVNGKRYELKYIQCMKSMKYYFEMWVRSIKFTNQAIKYSSDTSHYLIFVCCLLFLLLPFFFLILNI